MLRILSSRPYLFNSFIKKTRQLTVVFHSLSTESLPIQHDIDDDHHRFELSAPHHELLEVLNHHSSQLQSNRIKKIKPIELTKSNTSKRKKKIIKSDPIAELSEKLHIKSTNLPIEEEETEEIEQLSPILSPSIEELTFNDDDKTLNELLNSLHSTKVRRMHKYTDEQLQFMHKHNEFNRMLQAYVDVSISNGKLSKTRRFLEEFLVDQERRQTMKRLNWRYVSNVHIYNSFYFAYAEKGNLLAIQKLFEKMRKSQIKPTLESYAAVLNCLGNMDLFDSAIARRIILDLEKQGFRVVDIFNLDCLNHEQIQSILKVLKTFRPNFDIPLQTSNVDTKLLNEIYQQKPTINSDKQTIDIWWKDMNFSDKLSQQLNMENEQKVKISSINYPDKINPKLIEKHDDLMTNLEQQLSVGFLTELEILKKTTENKHELSIIPFLEIFDAKEYVDLMLRELNQHFYGSFYYSLPHNVLCVMLGKRLYQKYLCSIRQKNGFIDKLRLIYDDYMKYIVTNQRFFINERQKWNEIVKEKFAYMDRSDRPWTYIQILQIGEFLYDIMLKHLKLKIPLIVKSQTSIEQQTRLTAKNTNAILYTVYRTPGNFSEKQIKIHPTVAQFFSLVPQKELEFDCTELPCLVPPLPWLSSTSGGYLLKQTDFVRLPISANQQDARLRSLSIEKTGGLFDSINVLNSCPWKINKPVLDLLIEIFQKGGNRKLSVPVSVENANLKEVLPLEKGLTIDERKRREIAFAQVKKIKSEIFSLWCYELYRLSIANHFRNEIFWFPHNLDFRGRVYPVPPHFNHLGSDVARSIILFAEGKPLGDNGLRRLKIHLVNLTDLKKKCSIDEREKYADEIMDDILDSADQPLTGRQWWAKSEEPWQTLACCMEIARAIRSPDHTKYVCHFPVHQDGSCNVLQHYAAMGLDDVGAASVNLKPNNLPQDVYSVVVDKVEHERQQDAVNGVEIARILEGFVKRKVIKQTIMTTNYGVTLYGARQQIGRQLKDIDDFPKDRVSEASSYLAQKTFLSLRELFRETRKIQDWFTDCAGLISRIRGSAVEWNTPLNLPVVQPYYQEIRSRQKGKDIYDNYSTFARPNHIKQKNAFPPNYVHSLDSTHMMMTALQCARNGITFVSVHDSFWTHACDVDRLSQFCRQQFVALHDEPLLEILSKDFQAKYEFKSSEFAHVDENQKQTMNLLNDTLRSVPQRGTFQLQSVLDSTYFFS